MKHVNCQNKFLKACENGNFESMKEYYKCIKKQKNIQQILHNGLMLVVKYGTDDMLNWLLSLSEKKTIFGFVFSHHHHITLDTIFANELFEIAINNDNISIAKFILGYCEHNVKDYEIFFNNACISGNLKCAKLIRNICPSFVTLLKKETFIESCKYDKTEIVKYLITIYTDIEKDIYEIFRHLCLNNSVNCVLILNENNLLKNINLNKIANELLHSLIFNDVFKWLNTIIEIDYSDFENIEYVNFLIENNETDILIHLLNCEKYTFPLKNAQ